MMAAALPGLCSVPALSGVSRKNGNCTAVQVCRQAPLRSVVIARAQDSSNEDRARIEEAQAMQEAADLYQQAAEMAEQQVRHELMQMQLTEMQPPVSIPGENGEDSSTSSAPVDPKTIAALTTFWLEQGMQPAVADRVARDMVARGSRFLDVPLLATQLQRLSRIIPGHVQDMVARDVRILEANPLKVAQHYVQLVQLFPGNLDIAELAAKKPRLLYCDDLSATFDAVVSKLTELHPSHSRDEARLLLIEHPDLIFRMSYYMHVRSLDELPIDVQNIMIYTGQGLHHLHQMYSTSISPRFL